MIIGMKLSLVKIHIVPSPLRFMVSSVNILLHEAQRVRSQKPITNLNHELNMIANVLSHEKTF